MTKKLIFILNLFFSICSIYSCNNCENKEKQGQFTPSEEKKIKTLCGFTQERLKKSGYLLNSNLKKAIFDCDRMTIEEIFFGSGDSKVLLSIDQIYKVNKYVIWWESLTLNNPKRGPSGREFVKLFIEKRKITDSQIEELQKMNWACANKFMSYENFEKIDSKYYMGFDSICSTSVNNVTGVTSGPTSDVIVNEIISRLLSGNNYTVESVNQACSFAKNVGDITLHLKTA